VFRKERRLEGRPNMDQHRSPKLTTMENRVLQPSNEKGGRKRVTDRVKEKT